MTKAALSVTEAAAQWRIARRLYPIYSQIDRTFDMATEPSRELESPIDRSEAEVLESVNNWLSTFEEKIQPHQLRQVLQTLHVATPENLRDLLNRQLSHQVKNRGGRDKTDYLIVQYYAHCAPAVSQLKAPTFLQVADVLSEVLGDVSPKPPAFLGDLEKIMDELNSCSGLAELLRRGIVQRERELKEKSEAGFFSAPALVAFARSNYLLRHAFFRLLQADLALIRMGLQELEHQGLLNIPCCSAGLSNQEPLASLKQICDGWKTQFLAEYNPDKNFRQLLQILNAISVALNEKSKSPVAPTALAAEPAQPPPAIPPPMPPVAIPPTPRRTTAVVSAVAISLKIEHYVDQIADHLITVSMAAPEMMTLIVGNTSLMLASWEVESFVHLQDEVAITIQRGVAARLMLQRASELKGRINIEKVLAIAHAEAAVIQERIAEAKDKRDIDGAGRLAATTKRLLVAIEDAETL